MKKFISTIYGKTKFFFAQSIQNIRRNFLIGLTFAVCFSLVAGLSFTGQSAKNTILQSAIQDSYTLEDVSISFQANHYNPFYSDANFDDLLLNELESKDIPYYDYSFHGMNYNVYRHYFQQNDSAALNESTYLKGLGTFQSDMYYFIGDTNLYQSEEFQEKVMLFEGNYPTSEHEIMVDVLFADAFDYQVGESVNMSYYMRPGRYDENLTEIPTDIQWNITGIYALPNSFRLFDSYFSSYYDYDAATKEIEIREYIQYYLDGISEYRPTFNIPIFTYSNFSNSYQPDLHPYSLLQRDHPVFQMIKGNDYSQMSGFFEEYSYSMGIMLQKSEFNANTIESKIVEINDAFREVEIVFDERVEIYSNLLQSLQYFTYSIQMIQLLLFALNIPVIIFAIIMGSLAIKNETKNRLEEYLLLRSKGIKTRTLRSQLISESLGLSLFASGVGFVMGIPVFFSIRGIISQTLQFYGVPNMQFMFSFSPLWITLATGIVSSLIASIGSIVLIKRLPAHQILSILGQSSLDAEYSEKSIFGGESAIEIQKEVKIEQIEKKKKLSKAELQMLTKDQKLRYRQKQKLDRIYQRTSKKREKHPFKKRKIKIAFLYIFLGLLPIIMILLSMWAQKPNAPDFLYKIFFTKNSMETDSISVIYYVLPFAAIFTPFFLTGGIIRIIGLEKPQILARLSNRVLKPFLGKMSRLVGMEAIRKRQYSKVAAIVGVFLSITLFSSSLLYSLLNIPVLDFQAKSGTDVRVSMFNPGFEGTDTLINSLANITTIENSLRNLTGYQNPNVTIVDDVTTILTETNGDFGSYGSTTYELLMYANFSKLYNLIAEDGKYLPDRDVNKLNNLGATDENGVPNCIITSDAANYYNVAEGDTITVDHLVYYEKDYAYDMFGQLIERVPTAYGIEATVAGIIDVIPGVWFNGYTPLYPYTSPYTKTPQIFTMLDMSVLESVPYNLTLFSYSHFIDINDDVFFDSNQTSHIREGIVNATNPWYAYILSPSFYIDDFEELQAYWEEPSAMEIVNNALILEFGIIGLVLGVGIAVLIISFQQSNKFFNGVLLARGYGKKGLFKFVLSLISVIFMVAYIVGIIVGLLTTYFSIRGISMWDNYLVYGPVKIPIIMNWQLSLIVFSFIPVATAILYFINYIFESRKSVSKYFHKF